MRVDKRKSLKPYRSTLIRLSIIQSGLDTVVPVRVPKEFLKPTPIEELVDQQLARALLGNPNTLGTHSLEMIIQMRFIYKRNVPSQ